MSVSVTLSLHMYEYVCMRAAVSPGAKWASAEQNGEKKTAHDTSQPRYTMEGREGEHVPLQR